MIIPKVNNIIIIIIISIFNYTPLIRLTKRFSGVTLVIQDY